MKFNKLALSLFFAGMLILSGCGSSSDDSTPPPVQTTPPPNNPTAPVVSEISVRTIGGETISVKVTTEGFIFAGYEGKPVLLEFYGDTCPHCIDAIPMYNSLEAKYGNQILILTIESYGQLNDLGLLDYAVTMGINYRTVAKANSGNLQAHAEGLVGTMGGVPYLIILDRNGAIVTTTLGDIEASWLEGMILDLL